jgi:uncharacterized protein with von Willebrand factor type A (vWA) domain
MPPAAADHIAVAFARVLRGAGVDVAVGSVVSFAQALGALGLSRQGPVYWAGRTTLVTSPEDVSLYDRAFSAFWLGELDPDKERSDAAALTLLTDDAPDDAPAPEPDTQPDTEPPGPTLTVRYSPTEVLRHKDFAACSPAELAQVRRLMTDLRLRAALRRSRRMEPARRARGRPDLRRTVRGALRAGGEPVRQAHLEPGRRHRRVVLLCDVSGSMEPYARALLRFLHAAVAGGSRVEAFAIGTRLTRLTRQLSGRDPDEALRQAAAEVVDWSGGTRLGAGLRTFNDRWGVRGMARGAVVVILSDGWDRGDPEVLTGEMARLARVAHRVVWVNPLKASPGYAPLARGMAAALPYVDHFVEGHSVASLENLAEVMS